MIIKIDTREQELFAKCTSAIQTNTKFKDIQLISETLPLGDIIINDGTNDHIIIERKSLRDLAASIKDGRYEEQSYRLNGLPHHNHNIIYLIEGDMHHFNAFRDRIDKQTLYSAMFSINYFKGFSLMRTNNMEETATIVCNMVYKLVNGLKAGKTPYYSLNQDTVTSQATVSNNNDNVSNDINESEKGEPTAKDYCSVIKKVKKENVTQDNIGEIMLCQIPGVSSTTALAILSQFKTLPNLILALKENDKCLNDVCTTDANGKNRKISKTTIATIVEFLKI
jgi:ERCC4-type nuclease